MTHKQYELCPKPILCKRHCIKYLKHLLRDICSVSHLSLPMVTTGFGMGTVVRRDGWGRDACYGDGLQYIADLPSRCRGRLRSSTSSLLGVRLSRLVTVGDRSFAAAGPRLWNSLPADVQSAPSLTAFRQKLKIHLFRQSYVDIVL